MVKVAPVLPARRTTVSNCFNGRTRPYGPSIAAFFALLLARSVLACGRPRPHLSAYRYNFLVLPCFDWMKNSILPSLGREEMVKGCACIGASDWQDRNTCWPGAQDTGGSRMVTRVVLLERGVNSASKPQDLPVRLCLGCSTDKLLYM